MTLSSWLKDNWKHIAIKEVQGTLRVNPLNVDLTVGLLSTNSKEEFQKLVFHLAPVGIIVDEIPDEYYEGQLLKLRNMLTKILITEPNFRQADKWLKLLERRDKDHWSEQSKKTEVKATSNGINLEFIVRE
jgi:hypothetical protein